MGIGRIGCAFNFVEREIDAFAFAGKHQRFDDTLVLRAAPKLTF